MEISKPVLFQVAAAPGSSIDFKCSGEPVDIMQALISVMQANELGRAVILSVAAYWKENPNRDAMSQMFITP